MVATLFSGVEGSGGRKAEVDFAIKNHIVKKLDNVLDGLSDRLMTLKLPLEKKDLLSS